MISGTCKIYEIIKFHFVWFEWNVYKLIWRALVLIYDYLFTLTLKMTLIWLLKWMNFRAQDFYGVSRCHPRLLWYLMQKMSQAKLHKYQSLQQTPSHTIKSSFGWEECEIVWDTEGDAQGGWAVQRTLFEKMESGDEEGCAFTDAPPVLLLIGLWLGDYKVGPLVHAESPWKDWGPEWLTWKHNRL